MSILGFTGAVAADGTDNAAVEVEAVGGTTDDGLWCKCSM